MADTVYTTVSNVSAGKPAVAGAISVGATSLTLPTSATAAIPAGFANLGYISEDGLQNENERSSEDIRAWGGDVVLTVQEEKTDTFTTVLIEALNVNVLKAYFGDGNVSGDLSSGIRITVNSDELDEKSWVIDMVMRNNVLHRITIPRGRVTATEEINYVDSEVTGYGITITAYPDTAGNTHYEYFSASGT